LILSKAPQANCEACPLKKAPIVLTETKPDAKYWIVGESPGQQEVKTNRSFFEGAPSGNLLWNKLARLGITREQCNVSNAALCHPGPAGDEKQEIIAAATTCCKTRLSEELAGVPGLPSLVLGRSARESVFGPLQHGESLTTIHGRWVGNLLSTHHPAAILRDPDDARTFFDHLIKFSKGPQSPLPQPTYEVVTTLRQIEHLLQEPVIAYDLETDQIDFMNDDILMMVLASNTEHVYVVPGKHPGAPNNLLYDTWNDNFWPRFWQRNDCEYVGHNAKFDNKFLRYQLKWFFATCTFDTMLAHGALDDRSEKEKQGARSKSYHDLKGLSAQWLDVPDYEVTLKDFLSSKNDMYGKIPWAKLCQYASWDAVCTRGLRDIFAKRLGSTPQRRLFDTILMPMQDMYTEAEIDGMLVDIDYLASEAHVFEREMTSIEKEFFTIAAGHVTNMKSPLQLSKYFYGVLKLPQPKGRKVKPGSTNKDALAQLVGKHPTIDLLHKHRKVAKMRESYVDNVLECIDHTGYVHYDAKPLGTEVGRLSIRRPAIQTVPRSGEPHGKLVKDAYIAPPGQVIVVVDVSQAELRVAGAYSGEPFLKQVYEDGRDLHTEVTLAMFGSPYTKEQRVLCKMFNFSWLYGGNEYSFAQDAGLPIEQARKFVNKYNTIMPTLVEFKEVCFRQMLKKGYVESRFGRRRRMPYINDVNKDDARKAALHALVAGSASDMVEHAAISLTKDLRFYGSRFVVTVHDSILMYVPEKEVETIAKMGIDRILWSGATYFPEIKWVADAEVGQRWGSTKKLAL